MIAHADSSTPFLWITGDMLSHLNEVKTVTVLPAEQLLPQGECLVGPDEEEGSSPAAQPSPKRGHSRGRRAKGRRPSAAAAASKNRGEKKERVRLGQKKLGETYSGLQRLNEDDRMIFRMHAAPVKTQSKSRSSAPSVSACFLHNTAQSFWI